MPSLPLPLGSGVDGGALVASSLADIYAVLPVLLRPDDPAPVRDAIFNALLAIVQRYQQRSLYAAEQSDIISANGASLWQACSEIGVFVQPGESDTALKARALTSPLLVTPQAIINAATTILSAYITLTPTNSPCYQEALSDRLFIRKASGPNSSVISPRGYIYKKASVPTSPDDLSRLYPSEKQYNNGLSIPNREPGAARIFKAGTLGRYFVLRIPDLSSLSLQLKPVYQKTSYSPPVTLSRFFVGKGISATNTAFVRRIPASAQSIYNQIISSVNRIKGASIRWLLIVDPNLK